MGINLELEIRSKQVLAIEAKRTADVPNRGKRAAVGPCGSQQQRSKR